ncbi:unnamed protein product [Prunus armeniaca]
MLVTIHTTTYSASFGRSRGLGSLKLVAWLGAKIRIFRLAWRVICHVCARALPFYKGYGGAKMALDRRMSLLRPFCVACCIFAWRDMLASANDELLQTQVRFLPKLGVVLG